MLGIVLIGTDHNMPQEATHLCERFPGVICIFGRIVMRNGEGDYHKTYWNLFNDGSLRAAFQSMENPKDYVTVQGMGCTSLSFILGRESLVRDCIPGIPLVDMWSGVRAALSALKAQRIGLITPYADDVHETNVKACRDAGFEVVASMNFATTKDVQLGLLVPSYIAECAVHVASGKNLDCVLLGCSGMRVCVPNYIDELEARLGVPVLTSTQAFLWHMMRAAGVQDRVPGYGRLFSDF